MVDEIFPEGKMSEEQKMTGGCMCGTPLTWEGDDGPPLSHGPVNDGLP
jgi:hypothetical protein